MLDDERRQSTTNAAPARSGAEPAVPRFAWGHLVAILVGTAIIIAIVCTIATLSKKKEAAFSSRTELHQPDRVA